MNAAPLQAVSAMPGAPAHGLTVGTEVAIYSGHSNNLIGVGKVVRVLKRWVVVQSSSWSQPVRFRICAPLRGYRITGGLCEYLNEWIKIPTQGASDARASVCRCRCGV